MARMEIYGSKKEMYIQLWKALSIIAGSNHKIDNHGDEIVIKITQLSMGYKKASTMIVLAGNSGGFTCSQRPSAGVHRR